MKGAALNENLLLASRCLKAIYFFSETAILALSLIDLLTAKQNKVVLQTCAKNTQITTIGVIESCYCIQMIMTFWSFSHVLMAGILIQIMGGKK